MKKPRLCGGDGEVQLMGFWCTTDFGMEQCVIPARLQHLSDTTDDPIISPQIIRGVVSKPAVHMASSCDWYVMWLSLNMRGTGQTGPNGIKK